MTDSNKEALPFGAPLTDVEIELADPELDKAREWFTYHPPSEEQEGAYQQIRDAAFMFARVLLLHCPASADRTVALRKIREAVMTANASIALGGR